MFAKVVEYLRNLGLYKEESNIISFARKELEIAFGDDPDEYDKMLSDSVLKLLKQMDKEGHSGFSAAMTSNLFNKLSRFEPLTPLTGEDSEWTKLDYDDEIKYQNKRCSHVFKRGDGTAYDSNAYVFIDADGCSYTSSDSRKDITFPYTPTVEYIHTKE